MTIRIDLTTPAGHPYALMVLVQRICHELERGEAQAQEIIHQMHKGDSVDLLNLLDKEFPWMFEFVGDPRPRNHNSAALVSQLNTPKRSGTAGRELNRRTVASW